MGRRVVREGQLRVGELGGAALGGNKHSGLALLVVA